MSLIPFAPLKLARCPHSLAPTLVALPSMSLIPSAPLYLGSSRCARPLPRGFAGHVAHPIRSIRPSHGVAGPPPPRSRGLLPKVFASRRPRQASTARIAFSRDLRDDDQRL